MPTLTATERVLPVVGGSEWVEGPHGSGPLIVNVFGTAFAIADGLFLTAGHVFQAASAEKYVSLGHVDPSSNDTWLGALVEDGELFAEYDVAIIKAGKVPKLPIVGWTGNQLPLAFDIICAGYPFPDMAKLLINARVFKGHIVGTIGKFDRLPARPPVYELSFQCPRGLSGSPVVTPDGQLIAGIVIGNLATEMVVHEEREHDSDANRETIYTKVESLRLGIALRLEALRPIRSRLLGGRSLYDHVVNIR